MTMGRGRRYARRQRRRGRQGQDTRPRWTRRQPEKAGIRGRLLDFHGRGGWSLEVVGHRRRLTFSKNSGGTEIRQDKSIY